MQVTPVDTAAPIVPLTPYGAEPPPPRRRRGLWILPAVFLAALLAAALLFVRLPYLALAPGSATNVTELLSAPTDRAYPPQGDLYLLTVSLRGLSGGSSRAGLRPLAALDAWVDPDTDVVEKRTILGDQPDRDVLRENFELMNDSQLVAKYVAFRRLGYDIVEQGEGARVHKVAPGAPAAGALQVGDVITAVDGQPVATRNQVIERILGHQPRQAVTVTAAPDGGTARSVQITLGDRSTDGTSCLVATVASGSPCIGVELATEHRSFNFPFDVAIDAGRIGGPSAGLAFTLGLLDYLTPGELTGGGKVAVTGEIAADGRIGAVGGVAQKTKAAIDAGAEYLLVAAGRAALDGSTGYQIATKKAGDRLTVIEVATLEDAITALGRIGGDIAALGPPPATTQG